MPPYVSMHANDDISSNKYIVSMHVDVSAPLSSMTVKMMHHPHPHPILVVDVEAKEDCSLHVHVRQQSKSKSTLASNATQTLIVTGDHPDNDPKHPEDAPSSHPILSVAIVEALARACHSLPLLCFYMLQPMLQSHGLMEAAAASVKEEDRRRREEDNMPEHQMDVTHDFPSPQNHPDDLHDRDDDDASMEVEAEVTAATHDEEMDMGLTEQDHDDQAMAVAGHDELRCDDEHHGKEDTDEKNGMLLAEDSFF